MSTIPYKFDNLSYERDSTHGHSQTSSDPTTQKV